MSTGAPRQTMSGWASLIIAGGLGGLLLLKLRADGPLVGDPAPDFSLPVTTTDATATPERVRLADQRGHPVVLDFWASWCTPCRHSVPILNQVAQQLEAEGVRVLGVNSEGYPPVRVADIAQSWGFAYPVLHDADAAAMVAYQVEALPTVLLIDREGIVRQRYAGAPSAATLIGEVRKLAP
ncbi:MAG: TlpA disulfide reductase family protein [Polyangiales bacterium]